MKACIWMNLLLWLGVIVAVLSTAQAEDTAAGKLSARDPKIYFGGLYSTLTRLRVSLTTTGTRFFTCITSINNALTCTGRRRRRNIIPAVNFATGSSELQAPAMPMVHSSMSGAPEAGVKTNSEVRDPKGLFLTIFTTSTSTVTLGTYFSDTGTTVSVSFGCFDPSFSFPPFCG
ncbi:uncharacterized protein LOC119103951 [Pollicipes pollicipes]|uniref:uncharacterized protein LOC119103951 n=1 Tax=Pollicipes pollicipes TaxID=41117 RepID=UPI001884D306|nr:uncharacterized protein LOC119103951 [Pollicipes pollicipes]